MENQKYYELNVAGCKRMLPVCPLNENLSIAGFVILGDMELIEKCSSELLKKIDFPFDYLITGEMKGIPLAQEMARQHGDKRFFAARKSVKLYMADAFSVEVQSITTAGLQKLVLDRSDVEAMKGKRMLIVDDVVSTGASLLAMEKLVEAAGGIVVGKMAILAEGEAAERKDLIYLEKLPLLHPDGTPID